MIPQRVLKFKRFQGIDFKLLIINKQMEMIL